MLAVRPAPAEGWIWLSALRAQAATRNIPIVVLGDNEDLVRPVGGREVASVLGMVTAGNEGRPFMKSDWSDVLILNVDDNDGARYAKTRILSRAGCNVIEAATGTAALDLSTRPHSVLR